MVVSKEEAKKTFERRVKEIKENEWDFHGFPEAASAIPEEIKRIKLVDLHEEYKNLLYIEDTKRIDIVLAAALSNKLEGIPIWLIVVGASGDMKSVQLNALENGDTHYLHKITSRTLVNGYKDKDEHPDLAPRLDGKIVVIRDLAPLLKLPPMEKGEVWGQLRDLYDGFAGAASGQGMDIKYKDLKITLIAGSTPAIDGQILIHQDLGTRELIYRTKGNKNKKKAMNKCMENEETEKSITKQLRKITTTFLRQTKIKREYIPEKILEELRKIALFTSYMRSSAEFDQYSNELRNLVYPEEPTRIVKQLKRLFICLTSLAEDYSPQRALEILWEVAKSSSFPLRIKIFNFLSKQEIELSTSKIAEALKIGKSTTKRELSVFWNLGIVCCRKESTTYPDKFIDYWKINKESPFVKQVKGSHKPVHTYI
jgi:DNA-binding transcriptional ArsR family regulator